MEFYRLLTSLAYPLPKSSDSRKSRGFREIRAEITRRGPMYNRATQTMGLLYIYPGGRVLWGFPAWLHGDSRHALVNARLAMTVVPRDHVPRTVHFTESEPGYLRRALLNCHESAGRTGCRRANATALERSPRKGCTSAFPASAVAWRAPERGPKDAILAPRGPLPPPSGRPSAKNGVLQGVARATISLHQL